MNNIISPLTFKKNISIVKQINVDKIVKKYKGFGIDVRPYFKNLKKISILQCNVTGYQFYYPYDISGDSFFYEHFQKFDWYYMPWKWEHNIALKYLHSGMKVLEVGCAHGAFLSKISKLYDLKKVIGLELNKSAKIENNKWKIENQTIQDFAKDNYNSFDLVCSFQVLEHISDVHSFLKAKINCLKKGGTLLISVPNNNSFIKNEDSCLNMPPHHIGLWNEKSLKALEKIFPVKLLNIHFEPLQDYHVSGYVNAVNYYKYPKLLGKIIRRFNRIIGVYDNQLKKTLSEKKQLIGHTILVSFEKKND